VGNGSRFARSTGPDRWPAGVLGRRGPSLMGAVVLALATVVAGSVGCSRGPRGARHVVFISLDTARADHFGFMGSEVAATPRLDALAAESIVFTDYMTVVPTTLASHVSLLTGKYAHHHGTPRNGFMVNPRNEMLPEILRREGFRTAGFAGSFALDDRFDFGQGFDHYDQEFDVRVGQKGADQDQRTAEEVTDAVIRYLDERGVPERLFLFVHYFDPHAPYAAPAPFDTMYDPAGREGLPSTHFVKRSPDLTDAERAEYARRLSLQYASEISYTDHHVGRLLDELDSRGVLDHSLVVVTSDHGESLWEHDEEFDHGLTVYQSTMHAVCVMRLPGGEGGGTRVEDLVASVDVLPTVLRFLGFDVPVDADGEEVPLREAERRVGGRVRFGEATKPWGDVETDPRWLNARKARCVRDGRHKLIRTPYRGTEELYDVPTDPAEREDLLPPLHAETGRLAEGLRERLAAWSASAAPLPSSFEPSQREETIRRLRSLGYLE